MTDDHPIVFFDSGAGGLPYARAVADRLTGERLIYVADTARFPYGAGVTNELEETVIGLVERMTVIFRPRLIVIACNTASVVSLSLLRRRFDLPFVGVVPAIRVAAERLDARRIGLLATSRTAGDRYVADLTSSFAADAEVEVIPADDLVAYAEGHPDPGREPSSGRDAGDPSGPGSTLATLAARTFGLDAVVLGCTHFLLVRELIERHLTDAVQLVDSLQGVVNRVVDLAVADTRGDGGGIEVYVTSSGATARYRRFAARFESRFAGVLPAAGATAPDPAADSPTASHAVE